MAAKKRMPFLMGSHEGRQGSIQAGILRIRRDGSGFIRPLAGHPDFFVSRDEAVKALDGDLVRFEIIQRPGDRRLRKECASSDSFRGRGSARIMDILERRRVMVIGHLEKKGTKAFVISRSSKGFLPPIPVRDAAGLKRGTLVKASVGSAGAPGSVISVLPEEQSEAVELESAYAQGFSDVFPSAVLKEADELQGGIQEEDRQSRRDLTHIPFVTIDGDTARDFDDAVFAEEQENGKFRLIVAIADVAHYVPRHSAIDMEALRRGTSVYFPALVLPMLPIRLSNGLCSLNPGEERLSVAVEMTFSSSQDGCVQEGEAVIREAIIKSAARCTYDETEAFIHGADAPASWSEEVRRSLQAMARLAEELIHSRRKRGCIDLEIPVRNVSLDEFGRPVRILSENRLFSHRLIEAFMLSANESVARWFDDRDLPVIYRVHDRPDAQKLAQCLNVAAPHGFGTKLSAGVSKRKGQRADVSCSQIADFVDEIKGHPAESALNGMILRSMAQAVYSPDNIGHFGLASDAYLHFTSPIRRYPDLEVHRQLKEALRRSFASGHSRRRISGAARQKKEQLLDAIAGRSSERERAAMAAERDVQSWAAAAVAEKHIGETFQASVISITDFGAFAMLEDINVEGLVLPEFMGKCRICLDTEAQRISIGRRKILTLGSRIRVRIDGVDTVQRHINLSLA